MSVRTLTPDRRVHVLTRLFLYIGPPNLIRVHELFARADSLSGKDWHLYEWELLFRTFARKNSAKQMKGVLVIEGLRASDVSFDDFYVTYKGCIPLLVKWSLRIE